jgi:hypothetical protein
MPVASIHGRTISRRFLSNWKSACRVDVNTQSSSFILVNNMWSDSSIDNHRFFFSFSFFFFFFFSPDRKRIVMKSIVRTPNVIAPNLKTELEKTNASLEILKAVEEICGTGGWVFTAPQEK